MKAVYSKSNGGIYVVGISKNIPEDALDIPDALYEKYLNAEISQLDVVNGIVVEYLPLPKSIEQLQIESNTAAKAYLASTDWYVVRFAETGVEIPADISASRQAAREAIV